MSTPRLYCTFPLGKHVVEQLQLKENHITKAHGVEILYQPQIGPQKDWRNKGNLMYSIMEKSVKDFQPDVIIIGNNRVPDSVIENWSKKSTRENISPMIIRRGTELGGIPINLAKQHNISLNNVPGINSPYVARHMIRHLDLSQSSPGQTIAVLGAGDIGLPIIKAATKNGLQVKVISDSLMGNCADRRNKKINAIKHYLKEHRLGCDNVSFPRKLGDALNGAKYVAISVPWWLESEQRHNQDMIDREMLASLSAGARIVSASNPRIFSEDALAWMNNALETGRLAKVRIDTGHSYKNEVYDRYQCHALDVEAGKAFYCENGMLRLDRALLNIIFKHLNISADDLLFSLPRPKDDMDIESYVVDFEHFYQTESLYLESDQQIA